MGMGANGFDQCVAPACEAMKWYISSCDACTGVGKSVTTVMLEVWKKGGGFLTCLLASCPLPSPLCPSLPWTPPSLCCFVLSSPSPCRPPTLAFTLPPSHPPPRLLTPQPSFSLPASHHSRRLPPSLTSPPLLTLLTSLTLPPAHHSDRFPRLPFTLWPPPPPSPAPAHTLPPSYHSHQLP